MNLQRSMPSVNQHRCSGCGRCVSACHSRLVTLDYNGRKKQASIHGAGQCTNCLNCFRECPLHAIVRVDFA